MQGEEQQRQTGRFGSIDEDLDFMASVYGVRDRLARIAESAESSACLELGTGRNAIGLLAERLVPLACDGWTDLQLLTATADQPLRFWSLGYRRGADLLALREDGRICWWNDRVSERLDRTARCGVVFLLDFPLAFFLIDRFLQSPLPLWTARIAALMAVLSLFAVSVVGLERLQKRLPRPRVREWCPDDPAVPDREVAERVGAAVREALRRVHAAREESECAGTPRYLQALQQLRSFPR